MILDAAGNPLSLTDEQEKCDHGVTFDRDEAAKILSDWQPSGPDSFIMGNPRSAEVQRRWPRLSGNCPKGCGFSGIAYASFEHYTMGDW